MRWLRNREDAEDAVQDAVLSAFRNIASFEGRARMSSWLMTIVINSARMHVRRNRRNLLPIDHVLYDDSLAEVDILPDPRPNPEQMKEEGGRVSPAPSHRSTEPFISLADSARS